MRLGSRAVLVAMLVGAILSLGGSISLFDASADTLTIQPSVRDTYANAQQPDTNFGSIDGIFVLCCQDGVDELRMFIYWSVSSIPSGSTIINASLELQQDFRFPLSSAMTVTARRVTGSWTELGLTWNNQPSTTSVHAASTIVPQTTGVWVAWNVTNITDDWVNGGHANEGVRLHGATPGGFYGYDSREFATASLRPRLVVEFTPPVVVTSYLVRHSGNLLTLRTEVNQSIEIPVEVENTGDVTLNVVLLQLVNHTGVIVESTNLVDITVGEIATHTFTHLHGLSVGTYAWRLNATYTETVPDTYEFWFLNITVLGVGESVLNFVVTPSLISQNIPVDSSTTLHVAIRNTGTTDIFFTLRVTSLELESSPSSTGLAVSAGASTFFDFAVFSTREGLYNLQLTVVPINATTGNPLGVAQAFGFLLRVTEGLSVTTFSAADIGLRDVILQGKINALGGYESATVWFTLWRTNESVDTAVIYPTGKRVVGFVSDFRVWVGTLVAGTDYSYEFRLEAGPAANPVQIFGGVVTFTTTTEFRDPITAMRNGFAEWLGVDSIVMGFGLGALFVILTIAFSAWLIASRLDGSAAMLAILIPAWMVSGLMFGIGWFPLWLLVILIVVSVAMLVGMPQFARRAGASSE